MTTIKSEVVESEKPLEEEKKVPVEGIVTESSVEPDKDDKVVEETKPAGQVITLEVNVGEPDKE